MATLLIVEDDRTQRSLRQRLGGRESGCGYLTPFSVSSQIVMTQ